MPVTLGPKDGLGKNITTLIVIVVIIFAAAAGIYYVAHPGIISRSIIKTTITYEQSTLPCSIDPSGCLSGPSYEILQNIYETLVWYNGSSNSVIPWLAQNYSVSSNGTVYTFILGKGIQFCDGTQFNASAVKFSLDREILVGQLSSAWMFQDYIVGGREYEYSNHTAADAAKFLSSDAIQVLNQYEVAIHLSTPYAGFLGVLATTQSSIISPSYVMAHGGVVPGQINNWMNSQGARGTGPYNLQNYDPATGTAVLQANDHYWGGPYGNIHPKIQTVIIKTVTSPSTMVLDMKADTTNLAQITNTQLSQFINTTEWQNDHVLQSTIPAIKVTGPFLTQLLYEINMNEHIKSSDGQPASFQPFANKDVREAMVDAFNYDSYIKQALDGFGIRSNQPLPMGLFGFDKNLSYPTFNLTKARTLLIQAGAELGFSPSNQETVPAYYVSGSTTEQTAILLLATAVNQLGTGLVLSPQALAFPSYIALQKKGQLPMWVGSWAPLYNDPDYMLQTFVTKNVATNSAYHNSTVVSLVQQQAQALSTAQRMTLIAKAVQLMASDYAFIWVAQLETYQVMQANLVGYFYNPALEGPIYFATLSS